jgi:hypothetical protein
VATVLYGTQYGKDSKLRLYIGCIKQEKGADNRIEAHKTDWKRKILETVNSDSRPNWSYRIFRLSLNLTKHVYPVFGKLRINEIKRKDLKAFFEKLLINGLSSATISLIKAPISGVLSFAVDSEIIENKPLNKACSIIEIQHWADFSSFGVIKDDILG